MTYRPDELQIIFHRGSVRWQWVLEDLQGETVDHGTAGDYHMAARDALIAFDEATKPHKDAQP